MKALVLAGALSISSTAWADAVCVSGAEIKITTAATECTVPPGMRYVEVTIAGGGGGSGDTEGAVPGGHGALGKGGFVVSPGDVLEVLVGGGGSGSISSDTLNFRGGGGGGASRLRNLTASTLLVIAGGGGGGSPDGGSGGNAGVDATGLNGSDGRSYEGYYYGGRGGLANGNGGSAGDPSVHATGGNGGSTGAPAGLPATASDTRILGGGGGGAGMNAETPFTYTGGTGLVDTGGGYVPAPGGANGGGQGGEQGGGGGAGYGGGGGGSVIDKTFGGGGVIAGGGGGGSSYVNGAQRFTFTLPSPGEPGAGSDQRGVNGANGVVIFKFAESDPSAPSVQAVPGLGTWGIGALSACLGLFAALRRKGRQRPHRSS